MITATSLVVIAYLFGSVSSAIIICRAMGLPDPRTEGSNNPGATNVLRIGGKKAAALTLAGDLLKGLIPVLVGHAFGVDWLVLGLIGLAAFLGHLYPLFFGFKGGKGVATAIGVLVATHWMLGLAFVATWLIMAKVFKISSLAALVATALSPIYSWYIVASTELTLCISVMAILIFWRHRTNIQGLLSGQEGKIQSKEGSEQGSPDNGNG